MKINFFSLLSIMSFIFHPVNTNPLYESLNSQKMSTTQKDLYILLVFDITPKH